MKDKHSQFFNWGNNCRVLGYCEEQTRKAFNSFYTEVECPTEYKDSFWSGFMYGVGDTVVSINVL